ncbi:MAG: DUF1570 domain-containing protein [Planctomycetota bacterium]|jgi:hypothetical protein
MTRYRIFSGLFALIWLGLAVASTAPAAQAQSSKQQLPEHGIELTLDREYGRVPTEPNEEHIIAKWVLSEKEFERQARKAKAPRDDWDGSFTAMRPELRLVKLLREPDPEASERSVVINVGGDNDPDFNYGLPLNSTARYLAREMWGRHKVGSSEKGKAMKGWTVTEMPLGPGKNTRKGVEAWAYEYRNDDEIYVFIGEAHPTMMKAAVKDWKRAAERIVFGEKVDVVSLLRKEHYSKASTRDLLDIDYRIRVRQDVVDDWKVIDTENYIFVYHKDCGENFIKEISRKLEAIRTHYEKLFPSKEPVTAVSTVRICADRAMYNAYGGPPSSGGYWNSRDEELVFFDYQNEPDGGGKSSRDDVKIVTYHEGFHQYIYYSTGELAPHSWFNEGTGDYFSGAEVKGNKVKRVNPNPWRLQTIRDAVREERHVALSELVNYSQAEYYRNAGLCYAEGWSLIYFLRESNAVKNHDRWSQILDIYFETLKREYAAEMGELKKGRARFQPGGEDGDDGEDGEDGEDGDDGEDDEDDDDGEDPEVVGGVVFYGDSFFAGESAREKAVEAAFKGVDMNELEKEWKEFILKL